jgi:hypothetical protein
VQLGANGAPYIAAHGNLGEGDRSFLFVSSAAGAVDDYYPLAEMPLLTASGLGSKDATLPTTFTIVTVTSHLASQTFLHNKKHKNL